MLFVAGLSLKYIGGTVLAAIPVIYLLIVRVPYRLARFEAFRHPELDPKGAGFQLLQSLISVGSGGMSGVGLMESRQKLFFRRRRTRILFTRLFARKSVSSAR